jgi:hypothetical protein
VKKDPPPPDPTPAHTETGSTGETVENTPVAERERQIAVAREAHKVSLYPAMKPRLSYILSGERPGPDSHAGPPPVDDKSGAGDVKSVSE